MSNLPRVASVSSLSNCVRCSRPLAPLIPLSSYVCKLCRNGLLVRRSLAEELLLAGIRDDLLTPEIEKRLADRPKPTHNRRDTLRTEIGNLADAIASGQLKSSPALAQRLARAECELADLERASPPKDAGTVTAMLPRAMDRFRDLVRDLGRLAKHDVVRARTEIRKLVGDVTMKPDNGVLVAEIDRAHVAGALLNAAGSPMQMSLSTDSLQNIPSTWFTHFGIWGAHPDALERV